LVPPNSCESLAAESKMLSVAKKALAGLATEGFAKLWIDPQPTIEGH